MAQTPAERKAAQKKTAKAVKAGSYKPSAVGGASRKAAAKLSATAKTTGPTIRPSLSNAVHNVGTAHPEGYRVTDNRRSHFVESATRNASAAQGVIKTSRISGPKVPHMETRQSAAQREWGVQGTSGVPWMHPALEHAAKSAVINGRPNAGPGGIFRLSRGK